MNKKDNHRIEAIYNILQDIPFPQTGGGSATSSIAGMASFQEDMRYVLPALKRICLAILAEPKVHLFEENEFPNPDDAIVELRAFIQQRKHENWS